jgi:hypothetical protein
MNSSFRFDIANKIAYSMEAPREKKQLPELGSGLLICQ